MGKYFYEETGMYIDWKQLERLPEIDSLIDVGVGPEGTPDLYKKFAGKKLILIDPLYEAEDFHNLYMKNTNSLFFLTALGDTTGNVIINVEKEMGRSTIFNVTDINYEGEPVEKRVVQITTMDDVVKDLQLNRIGLKIDAEGSELNIIRGARNTLKKTKFVLVEVRHNHESFEGGYKLREFIKEMHDNDFMMTMILTAKPFIADLCFEPMH